MKQFDSKELKENEIWLGNTGTTIPERLKKLKTVRLGKQAYCIHGKKLDPNMYRPLFINKSEAKQYDRIMMNYKSH